MCTGEPAKLNLARSSVIPRTYTRPPYQVHLPSSPATLLSSPSMAHADISPPVALQSSQLLSFHRCLMQSTSIVAPVGAGLSAPSGLSTFSSNDGIWSAYDAASLATPEAFNLHPERVWQFYAHRRYTALQVQPNAGHKALAEASKRIPGFITLSQNVDGLCERAGHPTKQLVPLHGTLFEVRCPDRQGCGYSTKDFTGASTPSPVAIAPGMDRRWGDTTFDLEEPESRTSPACPQCALPLRPGVVWYGERLEDATLLRIRETFSKPEGVDIMLVVGTSAQVYPAAGYINVARARGARLCVVDVDRNARLRTELQAGDWFFERDASTVVPILLEPLLTSVYNDGIDESQR